MEPSPGLHASTPSGAAGGVRPVCRVGQARLKTTPSSRELLGRSADDRFARVRQDTDTETDKRTDKRETATDNQVTTRLSRSGRFRAFEWGKKNGVDGRKEPVPTTITLPLPQRQTANSVERGQVQTRTRCDNNPGLLTTCTFLRR